MVKLINSSLGDFFRSGKRRKVLNPLIVRPRKEGYYEIISGHRKKYAAERLGYKKIPVIIRMMQDDEAVVTMVDSNLQREQITPSEKAYAYKMKHDAIKKKAGRKNRYVLYCVKRYVQIRSCRGEFYERVRKMYGWLVV